jgi:hypothetical protein
MEKLQTDMASFGVAMKKQGEDTAAALKAVNASLASFAVNQTTMCENLKSFSSWMPTVEGSLHALQLSLAEVGERVAVLESALSSDDDETPRPDGHREDHHPQGIVSRASKAMAPALGKGTRKFPNTPVKFDMTNRSDAGADSFTHESRSYNRTNSRPPKTDFPKFDGENPKWWKGVCEKYFALYDVEHDTWASFASMHFVGNAALWLQTYEAEHDIDSWEELCVAIHEKFGKNKHHRYLQAIERCRQKETVALYYQQFEELRHKILIHNKHYDEAFFVTKFVKGLRKDIQRAIHLHHPRTVDAALSLAETQEELSEESRPLSPPSRYKSNYQPAYARTGFPGKGILNHKHEDKDKGDNKPQWQNKFQLLKAQRRERGECFKCGDKFHPGHKCSKSVPINLVEELVEILQMSVVDSEGEESEGNSSSEETFMHMSLGAIGGTVKKKSLHLQGTIRDKQVLILVDSGSFGNFISSAAVEQLGLPTIDIDPVTVTVANGAREQVRTAVVDVPWECQGATFTTSFRVFDLPSYDIIVGMDWFDTLGPMWMV